MMGGIHIDNESESCDREGHRLEVLGVFDFLGEQISNVLLSIYMLDVDMATLLGQVNAESMHVDVA
jgi:hypothetical protein